MKLTRGLALAFVAGILLAVAADGVLVATGTQKAELWGSSVVGFWAVLGLVAFVVIVGVSKLFGELLVTRAEDYYDEAEEGDDNV